MFLPDTNILIYALSNTAPFSTYLHEWITKKTLLLSSVVVAEFLAGATPSEERAFELILDKFGSIPVDTTVARQAAAYRKEFLKKGYSLKLPDCLIAATAKVHNAALMTFDPKDFPMMDINKKQI